MATITRAKIFNNGDVVTPAALHELIDSATIPPLVNADISAAAAIADTKLATISTANKVAQSAVTNLVSDLAGKASSTHTHGNITNAGAIGSTANLPVVTTASGVLSTIAAGSAGQVLTSNGGSTAPSWQTLAATSTNANNLTGGSAGTVPYQSAAGTTAMLAAGTTGQVLRSNGAAAPSWLTLAASATTDATNAANITTGTLPLARIPTGTTSTTVALGNHTHAATDITGKFLTFKFGDLNEASFGGFETTGEIGTTVVSDAGRNSVPGAILARWQRTNNSGVTSTIGTITSAGSGASTTGVAYNTNSDYRLKTNIEPLTDGVARLLQIPVHRFNWLVDPNGTKVDGFLAHEAQAVVPESVTGHKDEVDAEGKPVHQGIDQSKLVPLLVAAVQELVARVEALETAQQ